MTDMYNQSRIRGSQLRNAEFLSVFAPNWQLSVQTSMNFE
jgi:hypothetical protein